MIYRVSSIHPKKPRNGEEPVMLWHVDWFVFNNKTKVNLACPFFDEKRLIYVIWDNVKKKVLYTSSDLISMVRLKVNVDKVDWRELKENHPYLRNGVWYSFVKNVPITERHFIMKKHLGDTEIPQYVVVDDHNRRFVAVLRNDWIDSFVHEARKKQTDINAWREHLALPAYLEWGVYVPLNPSALLFDGKPDPRLARMDDMGGTVFLLDRAVKQLLYWNTSDLKWYPYELRDPGWGVFAGVNWRRKNVVYNHDMQMFTWRDSITYKNYGLVKGDDYEACSSIFKVLRTKMLDAFAACLEIPALMYELDVSTFETDIRKGKKRVADVSREIEGYKEKIEALKTANPSVTVFNNAALEKNVSGNVVVLRNFEHIWRRYRPIEQIGVLKGLLEEYAILYIQARDIESTGVGVEEILNLALGRKLRDVYNLFGRTVTERDRDLLDKLLEEYRLNSYGIEVQQRIKKADPTVQLSESVADAVRRLNIEEASLEKIMNKQREADDILKKIKQEREERERQRNTILSDLRTRIDALGGDIDGLKREGDEKGALVASLNDELEHVKDAISSGNDFIRDIFFKTGIPRLVDMYEDCKKNLQKCIQCENLKIKLKAELVSLHRLGGSIDLSAVINDINPKVVEILSDLGITDMEGGVEKWRDNANEGIRRIDDEIDGIILKIKRMSPRDETSVFSNKVDEIHELIKSASARKYDIDVENGLIDVINTRLKSKQDELHKLSGEMHSLNAMPVELPLKGEDASVIDKKKVYIREINELMKVCSSLQTAMCRFWKHNKHFGSKTKLGLFLRRGIEEILSSINGYETKVHPIAHKMHGICKDAFGSYTGMNEYLKSILPSELRNRDSSKLEEYKKKINAKKVKKEERKAKAEEKKRKDEEMKEKEEGNSDIGGVNENTRKSEEIQEQSKENDESDESDKELVEEGKDFTPKLDCYGLPDYYTFCQIFKWEPIKELPFVRHGVRNSDAGGQATGAAKRLEWDLLPVNLPDSTGKTNKRKKGKRARIDANDRVELVAYEHTPLKQVEEPYVYEAADEKVALEFEFPVDSHFDFCLASDLYPESDLHLESDHYLGAKGVKKRQERRKLQHTSPPSNAARAVDKHEQSNEGATLPTGSDVSELSFEKIAILPANVVPNVTHRVTRTPPLHIKAVPKGTRIAYFYTDYSNWVTYSIDESDVYVTPPPWEPVGTPMSHAVNMFIKKNKRRSEYQQILEKIANDSKVKRDTILCRKVCTGPSFFFPNGDVNQKIARPGAPLYPITDWHARELGFEVLYKDAVMSSDDWEALFEKRLEDSQLDRLEKYAKSRGVNVKVSTQLSTPFFLDAGGGGDGDEATGGDDSDEATSDEDGDDKTKSKKQAGNQRSHKEVDTRRKKGKRERRDANDETHAMDRYREGSKTGRNQKSDKGRSKSSGNVVKDNDFSKVSADDDTVKKGKPKGRGGNAGKEGGKGSGKGSGKGGSDTPAASKQQGNAQTSKSSADDPMKTTKEYFDTKYGLCPGGFNTGDWYHLLKEKEKNEAGFGRIFEPDESMVFKYRAIRENTDGASWMDRGDQMVLLKHYSGNRGYSLAECLADFCGLMNDMGIGRRVTPDDVVTFYEERFNAIKSIRDNKNTLLFHTRKMQDELVQLELDNSNAEQSKNRLAERKKDRDKRLEITKMELGFLEEMDGKMDDLVSFSVTKGTKKYTFNVPTDTALRKSELRKEIESIIEDERGDTDMAKEIDAGYEDRNQRIQNLIDQINIATEKQSDESDTAEQIDTEIKKIQQSRILVYGNDLDLQNKIRKYADSVDKDGHNLVTEWLERLTSDAAFEEGWMDVLCMYLETSISMTVLELDPDTNCADPLHEFTCDEPVYDSNPVMYVVEDADAPTYSLAIARKDYVMRKLMQYYREPENAEWIKARESRSKKKEVSKKQKEVEKVIVMDALGNLSFNRLGAVPISSLVVHEQPLDNYSFFSMCRDAMAAYLRLAADDIAPTVNFRRAWIDYLCYLPDEACNMAIGNMRISIPGKNRSMDNMREHVANTVGKYFFRTMQEGSDFTLTDEQLHIISEVGAPVSACSLNAKSAGLEHYPFRIIPCYELDNELRIRFVMRPKTDRFITVPFVMLVAYDVGEDDMNRELVRGNPTAHYYHLLCAPDVEYEARNLKEKRTRNQREGGAPKSSLNLPAFVSSGFYDPNFDHLCQCEGEDHPMMQSDMYQAFVAGNADSQCGEHCGEHCGLGVNLGMNLGMDGGTIQATTANSRTRRDTQNTNQVILSGGGQRGRGYGGGLIVQEQGTQMRMVDTGISGANVPDSTRSDGVSLYVDQTHGLMNTISESNSGGASTAVIVSRDQMVLESEKRLMYITNYNDFPKIRYFNELPPYVYPGVNNVYLPDVSKEVSVDGGSIDKFGSIDLHGVKLPPWNSEGICRIESGDARTFTFNEICDRVVSFRRDLPPKAVSNIDFDELFDYFWGYVADHNKPPPTKHIISKIIPDINKVTYYEYEAAFVKYLVDRERDRVSAWNSRSEEDMFTGYSDFDSQEPLSDVYLSDGVHVLPTNDEFASKYRRMFTVEFAKRVRGWNETARDIADKKIGEVKDANKNKTGPINNFILHGYFYFIIACIEAQWINYTSERTAESMLAHLSVSDSKMTWKSRKPGGQDHVIPDFMTARLLAPRNTAITKYLVDHAFQYKEGEMEDLIDVIGQSSFPYASIGHKIVGNNSFREYQEDFLHRIATEYSIMSITTKAVVKIDPATKRSFPDSDHAPLTMDALRVISRTYCGMDENKREHFLRRDNPCVNFVVVERVENATPISGQLKVVLTSDPRGLSLAFGLMQPDNLAKLPSERDYVGVEDKHFDFNFVRELRDVHCLSKILFILREPADPSSGRMGDKFFRLTRVQPCQVSLDGTDRSAQDANTAVGKFDRSFSTADILAGVRFAADKLVHACNEYTSSPHLPVRPYPFEPVTTRFDPNKKSSYFFDESDIDAPTNDVGWYKAAVLMLEKLKTKLELKHNYDIEMLETATEKLATCESDLSVFKKRYDELTQANAFFAVTDEAVKLNTTIEGKQKLLVKLKKGVNQASETLKVTEKDIEATREKLERGREKLIEIKEIKTENARLRTEAVDEKRAEKERKRVEELNAGKALEKVQVIEEKTDAVLITEAEAVLNNYTRELEKKEIERSYLHMTEQRDVRAVHKKMTKQMRLSSLVGRLDNELDNLDELNANLAEDERKYGEESRKERDPDGYEEEQQKDQNGDKLKPKKATKKVVQRNEKGKTKGGGSSGDTKKVSMRRTKSNVYLDMNKLKGLEYNISHLKDQIKLADRSISLLKRDILILNPRYFKDIAQYKKKFDSLVARFKDETTKLEALEGGSRDEVQIRHLKETIAELEGDIILIDPKFLKGIQSYKDRLKLLVESLNGELERLDKLKTDLLTEEGPIKSKNGKGSKDSRVEISDDKRARIKDLNNQIRHSMEVVAEFKLDILKIDPNYFSNLGEGGEDDMQSHMPRKQKLKILANGLDDEKKSLAGLQKDLEEKMGEYEANIHKGVDGPTLEKLEGYIAALKHSIQLSGQSIKRLELKILKHKLFDSNTQLKMMQSQRMDAGGKKLSSEEVELGVKRCNEEIAEYTREITEMGEVENVGNEVEVSDKEHQERQLDQQIAELIRKITVTKAEIEKLKLRRDENTKTRTAAREKHSEFDLEEERRRLFSDMRARVKFIKEMKELEAEIETIAGSSSRSALSKKKTELARFSTRINDKEASIRLYKGRIAKHLGITDTDNNLGTILGPKYSQMRLDGEICLSKKTVHRLGGKFWGGGSDDSDDQSEQNEGEWSDEDGDGEENERIRNQAASEDGKGFIEDELQKGVVYSVRESDRVGVMGAIPRVCFLAYSKEYSLRVPKAASREVFPVRTDMKKFALDNSLRVFVFNKDGDEIALSYTHDFRANIMNSKLTKNTAYFLLSGSCMFTLVPSVTDLILGDYSQVQKIHPLYVTYIKALYERVKLAVNVIQAIGTLSNAIGLSFRSESVKVASGPKGGIEVDVSHGSDIVLWLDRLDSEFPQPDLILPSMRVYSNTSDISKNIDYNLNHLDIYVDRLYAFYALAKMALAPVLKGLCLHNESGNEVGDKQARSKKPSILDEYISRASRMSFLCNVDFHYDVRLHTVYERFRRRVRNFHATFGHASDINHINSVHTYSTGDESAVLGNNKHLHSLVVPATHSKRLEGFMLRARKNGLVRQAFSDSIRLRLFVHTIVSGSFGVSQCKLVKMLSDNVMAKYFVEIKIGVRAPQRFRNHVRMRLTDSVITFQNPFDHRFYSFDHELRKTKEIEIQMPFWDKRIKTMCVIDHHDEFMRLFRSNSEIDKILSIMPSDENDENYDSSREELLQDKEAVLKSMREHQRLHLYAWNGEAFVHYNKIGVKECEKLVEDLSSKWKLHVEKIDLAEREFADASEKLNRLRNDAVALNMLEKVSGFSNPDIKHFSPVSSLELSLRLEVEKVTNARDEFVRFEEEFNNMQDLCDKLLTNSMNQDIKLEKLNGEFTDDGELSFTWRSSVNNVLYVLNLGVDGLNTTSMWHVYSGVSSWMIDPDGVFPVWNRENQAFDVNQGFKEYDVWIDPYTKNYHCLDYCRMLYFFDKNSLNWKPFVKRHVQSLFMEVKSITSLDDLAKKLGRITGTHESDFRLEILQNANEKRNSKTKYSTELTRTNFESTGDFIDMCEVRMAAVRMDCTNPGAWKDHNPLEARFVSLLEQNKNERSDDKNEYWKAKLYSISHGDVEDVTNWHEAMYVPVSTGGSNLPCDFDSHRYPTVCGGNPNDVAVDFGSSGHSPAWEHPIIVFRESYFLCNSKGDIMIISRKALHHGSTYESIDEDLNSGHIITNPTGVFAQNVERYWGYRQDHMMIKEKEGYHPKRTRLAVTMKRVKVINPVTEVKESIFVPDMKKLFGERVSVIHEWMHSPRNWYWDGGLGEFVVFAFSPDMVNVHRAGQTPCLVQEMVEYRVGRFYTDEFRLSMAAFLRDRKALSSNWLDVMGRKENKISVELRARVEKAEYKINGYPHSVCKEVEGWIDGIMSRIKLDKNYDNFQRYYKRLGGFVIDPYNNTPIKEVRLPVDKKEVIQAMSERQIGIRKRFWKLFRQKFDCSYHTFLTDVDERKRILSVSPEPLGPYAAVVDLPVKSESDDAAPNLDPKSTDGDTKSKGGKEFIDAWKNNIESGAQIGFGAFFSGYTFPDEVNKSDGSINGLSNDDFPFGFGEFDRNSDVSDVDDPMLEDWYWEQARVRLAGHN